MASLQDLQIKALEKGIKPSARYVRDVDADSVVANYVRGYSAEGALKNSVEGLDGFCSYWEEQSQLKYNLATPNEYIEKVNTIFSSYRTMRRNLDGTIAYLIGDWLLDCRQRFFPEDDRKTRGKWSDFLMTNLCKDFEKSTAYEFMAIAGKLKNYRQSKLPINSLKALLRAKNSGVDVDSLDINTVATFSTKEILAMREKKEKTSTSMICYKFKQNVDRFLQDSKTFKISDLDPYEIEKMKLALNQIMTLLDTGCGS